MTAAGGVPAELFDLDDPVWQSPDLFEKWLAREGLTVHDARRIRGPVTRHHQAACTVAIARGEFRTYGPSTYPWPDLTALKDLGVPIYARLHERDPRLAALRQNS
ncbi:hypothetical protein [Microbacterium sp.]|uniref:hypothetical protein n=1 Tax=Actinomycetes TaxID=1760 RepID=UPI0037C8157C